MPKMHFCLNRKHGSISTIAVTSDRLEAGYRVQIRERRIYGQIWEGVVDSEHVCRVRNLFGAFLGLRALLNVPADCPVDDLSPNPPRPWPDDQKCGDTNVDVTQTDPPFPPPMPPLGDSNLDVTQTPPTNPPATPPLGAECLPGQEVAPGAQDEMVDIVITDANGRPLHCFTECVTFFP